MTTPRTTKKAARPEESAGNSLSRRDFIAGTAATGIVLGVGQPLAAVPQGGLAPKAEDSLPSAQPEMYVGTPSGAVLAQLKAAGVDVLFHTNTSGFVPFWNAIYEAGDVQVILMTHEGQATAAAAGYQMASKKLGFFFGSHIGIMNSMSNMYCAWKDRVPLLITYSGGGLAEQGKDSFEEWDDPLAITKAFTNWSGTILPEDVTGVLRRAMKFAFGPPSGPVTLNWGAGGPAQVEAPIYKIDLANLRYKPRAQADLIQKAAQWLVEAQHPMIVAGAEIGVEGAYEEIVALAEKLSVPVTETMHSLYANFPTDHPLFLGELEAQRFPRKRDLLISFGESFTAGNEDKRGLMGPPVPIVQICHDPNTLGRSIVPDLSILSEVRAAIRDISDAVDGMLTKDRIARIRSSRLAEVSALTSELKQSRELSLRARFNDSPLTWERVGYELEKALDKDAVIVPELGTEYYKLLRQLRLGGTNKQMIGRTTGDALGWGMGAAFGVNVALPEKQVVAIQGDGGFLFDQSETFWSISRYQAPMLIVIMNNRLYNESRDRNMLNGGPLYRAGRDFNGYLGDPNVEYSKIAEAYNLKGERVKTASELAPALQRCLKSMRDGKAALLDIAIAPDGPALSHPTWYQEYSLADIRKKKRNL
jgi:thiamine pyrophosphate-dependent acetolactate synthase large subunit-like protein